MLELQGVTFTYPGAPQPALRELDLQLQPGQCLGLLGSNGAGKTTLLSLLSGVLPPQQGQIHWQGERRLGLVPQQLAFYNGLKVRENLELFADLQRLRGSERRQRLDHCIATCALQDKLERRAERLSGGEQRRLNFAIGLLQPADLYLFDEATVGVDAGNRRQLLQAVRELVATGKAVIYTSHYLDEVEQVADRILLLHEGRVQLDIDKQHLLGDQPGLFLQWPEQVPPTLLALFAQLGLSVEQQADGLHIPALATTQLLSIVQCLAELPQAPSLLRFGRPSLEQLYLRLNGGRL